MNAPMKTDRSTIVSEKLALAFIILLVPLTAQAQAERKPSHLYNDISAQVQSYPRFTVFDSVDVSLDHGVATLTGKVTMPYKRIDLEKRVATVAGVTAVVNKLDVLPASQFDDTLRYAIARAIYGNPTFWGYASMANPPIHIVVDGGRVTLTGVVNNEVERILARSLATGFGEFSVANELKTDAEMKVAVGKLD
jgi:hyperosmotically inducible protein